MLVNQFFKVQNVPGTDLNNAWFQQDGKTTLYFLKKYFFSRNFVKGNIRYSALQISLNVQNKVLVFIYL